MQQFIFSQEMALSGAPRGGNFGIGTGWAGPTIIMHGTEEQKKRYLPGIVQGDEVWCQGFSEPGAGSDLAAVQTRAVKDGDDYVVNGQKIWTSGAHVASFMILLARTDPEAPKHRGISYFIVDMKSPGIEVRPLVNMAGNHDFNEVFFDNVRVPAKNMIGEENRGWYVGTTTLDFERSGIATSISHTLMVKDLVTFIHENRDEGFISSDPGVSNELADRMIEAGVEEMLCTQVISMQNRGLVPNKESSIAKLFSSELDVRISRTAMKMLGLYGQLRAGSPYAAANGRVESTYLYATTSTVGGGTSEIQRNIIASRGLGLPRD
jgi:alkylation response protein AidB-like acyl-CoA dehydrogenase